MTDVEFIKSKLLEMQIEISRMNGEIKNMRFMGATVGTVLVVVTGGKFLQDVNL